ncbi:Phosphoenolpyruvate-protein phosphotransferase [Parvularcula bermudensis HTCC2503]|uniref:phosphoenolpyruvate--protein phosphotransferase n=1 Tax=Parvularcula bermudensis (strain ATCC BAA-594 / HTCC2503 / KCTC 12087) TaxID=314260 RepID=E0TFM9_PARBH|nr:phosphoenolpyruvate--protein phosphotransferase [Parvularcula bermudensis]ADM10589.1 Phosphoenolpyruvate-protein phosphotransferase [Parvularcula bermudensis HTCC2503]
MSGSPPETGYIPRPRSAPRALLRRIRDIMATETSAQARLDRLATAIAANMVGDVCSIYVRRSDDTLELFATEGLRSDAIHHTRLAVDEGLVGYVANSKTPVQTSDARSHHAFAYRAETGEDGLNAFLGVPITRSGQVLGVLVIQNRSKRVFAEEELEVAQTVATILAEVVATGELLDEQDREDVEAVLTRPAHEIGHPIVPGIGKGVVFRQEPEIAPHATFAVDVASETERLEDAIAAVRKTVDDMVRDGGGDLATSSREILEVFRLLAYDKGWVQKMMEKVTAGITAESAVEQVRAENGQRLRQLSDPYLRERVHDLDDLARRLLRQLSGEKGPQKLEVDSILVATSLGPAELLELNSPHLRGVVLADGATSSHAAIIARSLQVPMVSSVPDLVDQAVSGDLVLIDGESGEVHLRPGEDVLDAFAEKDQLRSRTLAQYWEDRDAPVVTKDGVTVELQMNAGLLFDLGHLSQTGASAVGLFRTEFQFLLGGALPTAAAQEAFYRQVLETVGKREVIFRTADIGSDKRAGYMSGPREPNPAMGWRGLRVALDRNGFLRTQIRALLAAARGRKLNMLLPLVTTKEEFLEAKGLIEKEVDRHRKHVGPPPPIAVGAMIEIPSAAWNIRSLAEVCDFLSIGGNDLAQFFFAADRENDRVSLRYDPLSHGFISFLARTIDEAKRAGKTVGFCGEQATDPLMALALIAIGVARLSVAATAIGPLRATIRSVEFAALQAEMQRLLAEEQDGDLRTALREWAVTQGVVLPVKR